MNSATSAKLCAIALLLIIKTVESKTVIVGDLFGVNSVQRLIFQKNVELNAFPLIRREENIYYEYPNPGLKIKGIAIKDLESGNAEPSIRRGGIGFHFVDINIISERGSGLRYSVEIFG